jgi:hypothetical protein
VEYIYNFKKAEFANGRPPQLEGRLCEGKTKSWSLKGLVSRPENFVSRREIHSTAQQGRHFFPVQICTQGQVMFLACSVSMMCAVGVTVSSTEAVRSLKTRAPRFDKRDIRTRVRKISAP